jgi:hypothetical protein
MGFPSLLQKAELLLGASWCMGQWGHILSRYLSNSDDKYVFWNLCAAKLGAKFRCRRCLWSAHACRLFKAATQKSVHTRGCELCVLRVVGPWKGSWTLPACVRRAYWNIRNVVKVETGGKTMRMWVPMWNWNWVPNLAVIEMCLEMRHLGAPWGLKRFGI